MTEEEMKMVVMLIRQQDAKAQPADFGGHMIAPPPMEAPMQVDGILPPPQQQGGDDNMNQIGRMLAERGGGQAAGSNATGAMMSNASMPAAVSYPTGAGSMAGSTAAAEMAAGSGSGSIMAAPTAASGSGAAGGGAAGLAAPAAAMGALIYGGKKLGIGAESQLQEYKRFGKRAGKEFGRAADKLKFWEWW